ncbi:MAG: AMP-dependent synthetase and ligase [Betaproteobacteria bacterium]|nr:AMP-dependent synthetase and ligase [Betaproteobacteria bacterium]
MPATDAVHVITVEAAVTLDGLFRERASRTPDVVAYRHFDERSASWLSLTWADVNRQVARWQAALERDGLKAGDRVAIMLRNCPEWVMCDIAALGLGLIVVPLYTQDRPENIAYILNNAGCRVLLFEGDEQWNALAEVREQLGALVRMVAVKDFAGRPADSRVKSISDWLPQSAGETRHESRDSNALATIVYTSGTTGRPKGVMLSHHNILSNVYGCLEVMATTFDDVFLSFLPLSHTFERTCGYYLTMMAGSCTAYARSIPLLSEDLQTIHPTVLVSVPRIYERVWGAIRAKLDEGPPSRKKLFMLAVEVGYARFEHAQGRGPWKASFLLWPVLQKLVASKVLARLGGRLRAALSGGAALPPDISRVFIGLGLPVLQGYGMTESSPVACANSPRDNIPASVGVPLPGVQVKIGEHNALLVKGPNVMLGYWDNPDATRQIMTADGWLNTGDTARIDEGGHVYITGRLKEIIVMSNGEKISAVDVEAAIARDPLFDQVLLLGEARPYLSVVAVLNREYWQKVCTASGLSADAHALGDKAAHDMVLSRVAQQLKSFPGYAQVRRTVVTFEPWTVENGLMTPTLKLKRVKVVERFNAEIDLMYAGH